jgi:hypothetical protein
VTAPFQADTAIIANSPRSWPAPIDAAVLLKTEVERPGAVIVDVLDMGCKCVLIGPAKIKKTYFATQLALSLATGQNLFNWQVRRRKVLMVNLELPDWCYNLRIRQITEACGISDQAIAGRFSIINGRASDISLDSDNGNLIRLIQDIQNGGFEVVIIDPLYKLMYGDENKAQDVKPVLHAFDRICTETDAAVVYVHHDSKGTPGERSKQDRGAGSNVIQRDMDAAIYLTPHVEEHLVVCGTLLRNYPPQDDFSLVFEAGRLQVSNEHPEVMTTQNRKEQPGDNEAIELIGNQALKKNEAVELLRENGFTSRKSRNTLKSLISSGRLAEYQPKEFPAHTLIGKLEVIDREKTIRE